MNAQIEKLKELENKAMKNYSNASKNLENLKKEYLKKAKQHERGSEQHRQLHKEERKAVKKFEKETLHPSDKAWTKAKRNLHQAAEEKYGYVS